MKKQTQRLQLNRSTIRVLTGRDLRRAAGGTGDGGKDEVTAACETNNCPVSEACQSGGIRTRTLYEC